MTEISELARADESRVAMSVRFTEAWPRDNALRPGELRARTRSPLVPLVAFADEDIEHDSFGTIQLGTGDDFDQTVTADSDKQYEAYNPGLMVWNGARLLVLPAGLSNGAGQKWQILHAFSATRIRATAPAGGITAGTDVSIDRTTITALNGEYSPTSDPDAFLETIDLDVQGSATIWCELTWVETASESRWEVTSADCA